MPAIILLIDDRALPIAQINFAMEVAKVAKHTVLVLVQGRPRTFQPLLPHVEAILYAYLPGPAGGPAIANIIFGLVNPYVFFATMRMNGDAH